MPAPRNERAPVGRLAKRGTFVVAVLLVVLALFVFGQVRNFDFTNYDDPEYVTENFSVRDGLKAGGLVWGLTSVGYSSNWHPLTWLSHMADVEVFGVKAGPMHLVNVALHAASAVLLLLVLTGMTGGVWGSALVAALFAVHPLHVESVAWIAERKDVLSGFFFMLVLAAWLGYLRRPGWGRYLLVAVLFAFGLMAKPMLVTVPCLLLVLDWWPLGRLARSPAGGSFLGRVIIEKAPLLALSAAASLLTFVAQTRGDAIITMAEISLPGRVANVVWAYGAYLLKTVWPAGLVVYYPLPAEGHPAGEVAAAGLILVALSALAWVLRQRAPGVAAGWLWYLGMLVPVIGVVQVGSQSMADRYTYLPLIGIFGALAWGVGGLVSRKREVAAILLAATVTMVIALAAAARVQTEVWRDSRTLFNHALRHTRENFLAHINLGVLATSEEKWAESVEHYMAGLAVNDSIEKGWFNLGISLSRLRRWNEAIAAYREAIRVNPRGSKARFNLALLAVSIGDSGLAREQYAALAAYDPVTAAKLAPFLGSPPR
jgi:hypothetical protein